LLCEKPAMDDPMLDDRENDFANSRGEAGALKL
jgi:hypothetical protein